MKFRTVPTFFVLAILLTAPRAAAQDSERDYTRAMRALDQRKYAETIDAMKPVIQSGGSRADAALYWTAYAQSRLGRRTDALATIATLKQKHPNSRWANDAGALEVELKQASGQPVSPAIEADDDIKLMALNGLMQNDPDRALPIIEKMLQGANSPKVKERALFVLSQSDSPKARAILLATAKGAANPDLQRVAIRNLAVHGGKESSQTLAEIYQSQTDKAIKREILRGYMVMGDGDRLGALAKSEKDPDLRREAIRQLGAMGNDKALSELFAAETSPEVRSEIVNAFMVSGAHTRLIEIVNTEKDPAVQRKAVQMLGVMDKDKTGDALVQVYGRASQVEVRKTVLRAFMTQGNAQALVNVARKETNPDLKREAVRMLSVMKDKVASDYMLEVLEK